jgi:hypothetical protein
MSLLLTLLLFILVVFFLLLFLFFILSFEIQPFLWLLGYVEDGPIARLFRQSPLNAIWEGSGNVICLDVLRAITKHPKCVR